MTARPAVDGAWYRPDRGGTGRAGPVLIGYLLAGTADVDALPGQRQALQDAGCERVVEDGTGGGHAGQPGLRRLLEELSVDVVVVVPRMVERARGLTAGQDLTRRTRRRPPPTMES